MLFLRQSTAVDIGIGPFVDQTDGFTAETTLTISQADVRLKKNNGAWAQVNDVTAATHEENGWYEKELDATDTNTVGLLLIAVNESGALPVWQEYQVLEEAVYDALFAASAPGYGTAQTGDSFARLGAPAGASIAADLVVIDNFVDDLESRLGTPSNLGSGATISANLVDIEGQTDDIGAAGAGLTAADDAILAILGTPAGASMSADIAAIEAQTDDIGAAGAGLTAIPWNAAWDAEVESEVDDALGAGTGTSLTAIPWNSAWDAEVESEAADALNAENGANFTAIPWNAAWDAEVQSEVDDSLNTAISELSAAAPTATPTVRTALMLLYMALRNERNTTATADEISNDAGATICTATLSDDATTFTKGEYA